MRHWQILAVTALAVFVVFLDTTIVNIAFPAIGEEFARSSPATLSWILNAYTVVFAALLITAGKVADRVGRRRVFLWGLALFAGASALCGAAPTAPLLVAARALQAVGAAMLLPTSLALLLPAFPFERRSTAVGLWGATAALAAALGPTVGALLVQGAGWRWVFLVNVPVCAAAMVAGLRVLDESVDPGARRLPDPLGVVLVIAGVALLSLGIVQGPEWGWASAGVVASLAAAAVLLPLFVLRSARHPAPVLDLDLFGDRDFRLANAATLAFAAGFYAAILANVLFLTGVWQFSFVQAALAVTPSPLLAAALAGPSGRLADRWGHRRVIVPGALVYAAGQLWLATQAGAEPAYVTAFLPAVVLSGIGIGIAFPTLGSASASALPPARFAVGSAVNSTARQLGAVLGVSVLIAILGAAPSLAAFRSSWGVILAAAAATAGLAAAMSPRITPATGPTPPTADAPAAAPTAGTPA